jgi:hypothetical protein
LRRLLSTSRARSRLRLRRALNIQRPIRRAWHAASASAASLADRLAPCAAMYSFVRSVRVALRRGCGILRILEPLVSRNATVAQRGREVGNPRCLGIHRFERIVGSILAKLRQFGAPPR